VNATPAKWPDRPESSGGPDESSGRSVPDAGAAVSGKFVLLAMVGLGLAAALGTWRFYAAEQRRPLELWGPEAAELIVRAEKVEVLQLEALPRERAPVEADARSSASAHDEKVARDDVSPNRVSRDEIIPLAGRLLVVRGRRDVSTARGLGHLRVSLVNEASFDWSPEAADVPPPHWDYALRFSRDDATATIVFASREGLAALAETGAQASIGPIRDGVAVLLAEMTSGEGE